MPNATMIGTAFSRRPLFPDDLACSAMRLERDDKRALVRMLVNSLVWIVAGMLLAVAVT